MSQQDIQSTAETVLGGIKDPETGKPLSQSGQILSVETNDSGVTARIGLTAFCNPIRNRFAEDVRKQIAEAIGSGVDVQVSIEEYSRKPYPLGQIGLSARSVIAVGSGKGGVGKSTVATMLALALHRDGCKVGLMDADVYGPSIPHMLGLTGRPEAINEKIQPVDFQGMPVMSIGLMVPPDQAVVWRGPMLHSAVTQFLRDTNWGELDFLIIDMPPGTGDVALSLSQLLPITGSVVVCTPQQVAMLDAVKAIAMFEKVNIGVLGLVENMNSFVCPDCNKRYDIFGSGGVAEFAKSAGIALLGELPINIELRKGGDSGQMQSCLDQPVIAETFSSLAENLVLEIARRTGQQPVTHQLPVLG